MAESMTYYIDVDSTEKNKQKKKKKKKKVDGRS